MSDYVPDLAGNLVKYAEQLLAGEDLESALDAATEAVDMFAELLGSDMVVNRPHLARALTLQARAYSALERFGEALVAVQRATELYELAHEQAEDKPVLRADWLVALELLGSVQLQLGQVQEGLRTADKAIEIEQRVQRRRRSRALTGLWLLRASALLALGLAADAVASVRTALDDADATTQPQLYILGLEVLSGASDFLRDQDDPSQIEAEISELTVEILRRTAVGESPAARETSEAIDLYRRIAADTPDAALPALAGALQKRALQLWEQDDLQRALQTIDEAVIVNENLSSRSPGTYRRHLAIALGIRAEITWAQALETEDYSIAQFAITDLKSAIALVPHGGDQTALQTTLARVCVHLAVLTEDGDALDVAIEEARFAYESAPNQELDTSWLADILCRALYQRFKRMGRLADLNEAIEICRDALSSQNDPNAQVVLLNQLGSLLMGRSEVTGALSDLEEAIELTGSVATRMPDSDPRRGYVLHNLGQAFMSRFTLRGALSDLDSAISTTRTALDVTPSGSTAHAPTLLNLAQALFVRYERSGNAADLDEAIEVARAAVLINQVGSPSAVTAPYLLALALYARFQARGDLRDLDAAIDAARQAHNFVPPESANVPVVLGTLTRILLTRFERLGDLTDVGEAIDAASAALEHTSSGSPDYAEMVGRLGEALSARYRRTDVLADAEIAIDVMSRYVAEISSNDPALPHALTELCDLLLDRFHHNGDRDDLNRAIEVSRQAIASVPTDHPIHNRIVELLARALVARSESDDLNEAIDLVGRAIMGRSVDRSSLDWHQAVLDTALGLRIARYDAPTDRAALLINRYEQHGDPNDLAQAIGAYRDIALTDNVPPVDRVRSAHQLGRLALTNGHLDEALDGFRLAIKLLPLVLTDRVWRENALLAQGSLTELVSDAAACAIRANRPDEALSLLEQGRGLLLSRALGIRDDLAAVRVQAPDLADLLASLTDQLDTSSTPAVFAHQFDQLVSHIRTLPGLENFLLPPEVGDLVSVATQGPIVVINLSDFGCHALLVTADGVNVVDLLLDRADVINRAQKFLAHLTPGYQPLSDRLEQEGLLTDTLSWLWDTVTRPVFTALGIDRAPEEESPRGRLWWIPTGPMTLFPLHAAGRNDNSAMFQVVSSYAVTITALAQARAAGPAGTVDRPGLVILPHPTSGPVSLPGAEREASMIADALSAQLLTGAEATTERVRDALSDVQILHFAGHGLYDSTDPAKSGLLCSDDLRLSPLDLVARNPQPQLAFLSACLSTHTLPSNAGETVNIGMLFQQAGFRHTIGTLWEVNDRAYADIAVSFYRLFDSKGFSLEQAAAALHLVTRSTRSRYPHIPSLWAAHIHLGP